MNDDVQVLHEPVHSWLARTAGFFAFWLVLSEFGLMDCLLGLLAAVAATWTSVKLMPPGRGSFRPVKLGKYVFRFLLQSIVAGVDVAWRALDPRMPLRPGFVTYRAKLQAGSTFDAFCTISSLLPGTLPCGTDTGGALSIHCLDVTQPVADQMAEEESLFADAVGEGQGDV